MPRTYSMDKRIAAVEETRQRIVDATVALHNEKGILATTMQDIAARAGVALGTVYRHFPTLEDLVPACGARNMELSPPPDSSVYATLDGEARIRALLDALFAHYAAARRPYEVGIHDVERLPVLREIMAAGAAAIRGLVSDALSPLSPSDATTRLAWAMSDFRTWQSFADAGFVSADTARIAADAILSIKEARV